MRSSTSKTPAEAKTWAELCALKSEQYAEYLKAFSGRPSYAQVQRPTGDPDDFPIWRELYFGKGDPNLRELFRTRCVDDLETMFSQDIFERCRHNPASNFPADRALARSMEAWLSLFSGKALDVEQLRLAADDYYEWVAKESFGGHDEIDEFRIVKGALLYFLVGDLARAEMLLVKLPGKKTYHRNLVDFASAILEHKPPTELGTEQLLERMLAVDYYWDPKRTSYVESDVNFLLIASWASFKEHARIDKASATAVQLASSLVK